MVSTTKNNIHDIFPNQVQLIEVGPRDGFQMEKKIIPTWFKIEIINKLVDAGLNQIQITAFVHSGRVPQMADAEKLFASLPKRPDIIYNALVLNKKGLNRALNVGVESVEISISASDTHSRINTGLPKKQALKDALEMIAQAKQNRCHVRAGIQCAFGCVYQGNISSNKVLEIAKQYIDAGIGMLAIADTTGMANPQTTTALLNELIPLSGDVPIVMHLHDRNGMGLANMNAALMSGVLNFDTSIGGMGGCPFVPGTVGNLDTIKVVRNLESKGIETGLDMTVLQQCEESLISFLQKNT
jgi:hydroxymethylglutaryl-CoA lyase